MPADPKALFKSLAPRIMRDLIADFALTVDDAAAIVGNLGHESGGFRFLQEIKPVVPGSRGGYGWAQWTGPRRVAFEAWCKRKGFKPESYEANYSYLFRELVGAEKAAVRAVKAAKTLRAKVEAFEAEFERAGVKHYDSREAWAKLARVAYLVAPPAAKAPVPPPPDIPAPAPTAKPAHSGGLFAALGAKLRAAFPRT